ncbi:RNA-directed DNA polymerase, eukaryota [Tanacetum coccineum]
MDSYTFMLTNTEEEEEEIVSRERNSRLSLDHFCTSVMEIFGPEYLRKSTVTDAVKHYRHHEEENGFSGMSGYLDCTDWEWFRYPYAFKGRTPEIPFVANNVTYPWGYYLVDGIYPKLATLVKTIP